MLEEIEKGNSQVLKLAKNFLSMHTKIISQLHELVELYDQLIDLMLTGNFDADEIKKERTRLKGI